MIHEVCIVGRARTPIGSYGGSLSKFSAVELGSIAIKGALDNANIEAQMVDEVFMGNVLSAGLGQAPARQAALGAGISIKTPCTTVNKVCSSGMKAIMLGAQTIMLGQADIVACGGMESMSNCPYYNKKVRFGSKMGDFKLIDGVIHDGLWDPYKNYHMGVAAELCSTEHKITRQEQDEYAIKSYKRAIKATKSGLFAKEIVSIDLSIKNKRIKSGKKELKDDEELAKANFKKLQAMKPYFVPKDGTVTPANASSLSDGAAALILTSQEKAKALGLKVLATIRGFADAAQEPERFTTAPSLAIPKAIQKAKLNIDDINFFEINEAFSVVTVANERLLKLDPKKVNCYGGAVSMGHPIGCSGARIVVTLLSVLTNNDGKFGAAGVCNGGGGASAIVIENRCTNKKNSKL